MGTLARLFIGMFYRFLGALVPTYQITIKPKKYILDSQGLLNSLGRVMNGTYGLG